MNYLETLTHEWLDFVGYFVRSNVNVGRLKHGGHSGELDIVAYQPDTKHCLHVECSGDADSWAKREKRFKPKFKKRRKFIRTEVFPWRKEKELEQWALVWAAAKTRKAVGGGKVVTLSRLLRNIASDILNLRKQGNRTIPEKYPLLRAIQDTMLHVGDPKRAMARLAAEDRLLPSGKPRGD